MTESSRRDRWRIVAAAAAASACAVPAITGSATGDSVSQLQNKLGSTQSQLNSNKQHEQGLAGRVSALNNQVSVLASHLQFVQSREAAAQEELAGYEDKLAAAKVAVTREQLHLKHVRRVLVHSRRELADELRGQYEAPQQSLVSVLVNAKGMQQLLDTLQYESAVKHSEQSAIKAARVARRRAIHATARLEQLQKDDASAASTAQTQTNALAGMNALLSSQQSALADERAAQSTALAASQERGAQLQAAVATIQKQEQAAVLAAQTIKTSSSTDAGSGGGSLSATAGWAIPYKIVLCESGGQNLPPNSAGASGYYQILPSTWRGAGGSGPAAYLASKSEQDAVAARIWNGGAGASNWSCSAITGIT
jgi:septal ring factor EnvC (AmiA/AmiB activator)